MRIALGREKSRDGRTALLSSAGSMSIRRAPHARVAPAVAAG
jgi:hypothetical protein